MRATVFCIVRRCKAHGAGYDILATFRADLNLEFVVEFNFAFAMRAYLVGGVVFHGELYWC